MKRPPAAISSAAALALIALSACAPTMPFSTPTPGLSALGEEQAWVEDPSSFSVDGLRGTDMPELSQRVANLHAVYAAELGVADAATGGLVNGVFKVASLVLPISGMATSLLVSNADDAAAIAAGAAGATALLAGINTIFKPEEKRAFAESCAVFMRHAVTAIERQWPADQIDSIESTPAEWRTYFAVRSALEAGRTASCTR